MNTDVLAGLMAELPEGMVVTDPAVTDGYRQDRAFDPSAGKPLAIIRPRRTEEVQTVLRWASANQVPVVTRGAGSGLSGGATALDGGIVLSTEKMRDITVDPVTRTAVCQPGLYNAEVKEAAAEHGLWYPPDPSSFEICSIGGNIATNAGGLCCVKYGVTGDYVLGMQVVLANGTAVRLGGPRLKDVAGLSLTKLFVGSEGTLGVITEVTLRLLPAQNASSIVVARDNPALAAWFTTTRPPIGGEMAGRSEVIAALAAAFLNSLGPDDPTTVERRARWVVRMLTSLLMFPGRDEADERAMIAEFVVPIVTPASAAARKAGHPGPE